MIKYIKCLRIIWILVLPHVAAFKASDFKTCDQNPFCKRNRARSPGETTYSVSNGFTLERNSAVALLNDVSNKNQFKVSFSWIKSGSVRMHMSEIHSARYEVKDILVEQLPLLEVPWDSIQPEGPFTRLIKGHIHVFIHHEPFAFRLFNGREEVFSFNDRALLHYEEIRSREEGDSGDLWEAKFKGFTDHMRAGPQSIMFDASFPGAQALFGIPEHATSFALKPTQGDNLNLEPYRLYNLDVFEYVEESPFGLYGSIPMLLAHGAGASGAVGLFWLNAAEMYVDVQQAEGSSPSTTWMAESGVLDLFIMTGPSPAAVVQQYSALTGPTSLPPLFSLGYHQCRWNYRDEADVAAVDAGFDSHAMPVDVIWLDIEHTNGKRYFTWDANLFPTPERMQDAIAAKGRKMVNIVDPHIKRDAGYYVHAEASAAGHYVKDSSGNKDYEGWCWPGSSSYLDFTSPAVRDFWSQKFSLSQYKGSTSNLFIWNDMNEPSVFNGPEITMPKDAIHSGNIEHRDVHNLYGYYLHKATSDGLMQREPGNQRPFVLSRAFFAGTQRIGPIWTGDNAAEWSHLQVSLPMLLSLGVSGLTFSGADVGGFFGNPAPELLVRWYQVGAFYPFFRGHAHQETKRREPWLFGEPTTTHIRDALRMRYSMLPYIYTLFAEASVSNAPVMRPLFYEFPTEAALTTIEDQFMLGPSVLVAPVLKQGQTQVDALLPGSESDHWYCFHTGARVQGAVTADTTRRVAVDTRSLSYIPVFLRGGSILPRRDRPRRSALAMQGDPYTLVVALNSSLAAQGDLYEDDGISTSHKNGAFVHRLFTFADNKLTNVAKVLPAGNAIYTTVTEVERIVILGLRQMPQSMVLESNGQKLQGELGSMQATPVLKGPTPAFVIRKPGLQIASDW
eukprot:CAMPEP_0196574498 /NCGR_PEP_ID=MMETSP1081-20130531/4193_1 /TAXON_ID=36882 /ORGANISM="Pyramimonas amylifera, Strain CCMP720" /LENGTH=898 /DNA_ID=CAMNT_0041892527 /DNA_START=50 /DNA_END=2743 /DNA_ORIENTATION=+